MAVSFAFMIMTVQYLLAFLSTLKHLSLFAAFYRSLRFTALAGYDSSFIIARFALSRVANIRTIMRAISSSFLPTNFSTRMWFKVAVLFRIEMLSTITVIFWHWFVVLKVALRTFPIEDDMRFLIKLLVDVLNPLLNAFKMHGYAAADTCPDPIFSSYVFSADNAILFMMAALSLLQMRSLLSSIIVIAIISGSFIGVLGFNFMLILIRFVFADIPSSIIFSFRTSFTIVIVITFNFTLRD
jgi:hypothetical protein